MSRAALGFLVLLCVLVCVGLGACCQSYACEPTIVGASAFRNATGALRLRVAIECELGPCDKYNCYSVWISVEDRFSSATLLAGNMGQTPIGRTDGHCYQRSFDVDPFAGGFGFVEGGYYWVWVLSTYPGRLDRVDDYRLTDTDPPPPPPPIHDDAEFLGLPEGESQWSVGYGESTVPSDLAGFEIRFSQDPEWSPEEHVMNYSTWPAPEPYCGYWGWSFTDFPVNGPGIWYIHAAAVDNAGQWSTSSVSVPIEVPGVPVAFVDDVLEAAIRQQSAIPEGNCVYEDDLRVTSLSARGLGILDLTGLGKLTHLTSVDLAANQIVSVAELAGLSNLTELDLSGNQIHDVTPLAENTALGAGVVVDLAHNFVDVDDPEGSQVTAIQELIDRGALVSYSPQDTPFIDQCRDHLPDAAVGQRIDIFAGEDITVDGSLPTYVSHGFCSPEATCTGGEFDLYVDGVLQTSTLYETQWSRNGVVVYSDCDWLVLFEPCSLGEGVHSFRGIWVDFIDPESGSFERTINVTVEYPCPSGFALPMIPTSPSHVVGEASDDLFVVIEMQPNEEGLTACSAVGYEVAWTTDADWIPTGVANTATDWSGETFEATSSGEWYLHVAAVGTCAESAMATAGPFTIDLLEGGAEFTASLDLESPVLGTYLGSTAESPALQLTVSHDSCVEVTAYKAGSDCELVVFSGVLESGVHPLPLAPAFGPIFVSYGGIRFTAEARAAERTVQAEVEAEVREPTASEWTRINALWEAHRPVGSGPRLDIFNSDAAEVDGTQPFYIAHGFRARLGFCDQPADPCSSYGLDFELYVDGVRQAATKNSSQVVYGGRVVGSLCMWFAQFDAHALTEGSHEFRGVWSTSSESGSRTATVEVMYPDP